MERQFRDEYRTPVAEGTARDYGSIPFATWRHQLPWSCFES